MSNKIYKVETFFSEDGLSVDRHTETIDHTDVKYMVNIPVFTKEGIASEPGFLKGVSSIEEAFEKYRNYMKDFQLRVEEALGKKKSKIEIAHSMPPLKESLNF